MIRTLLQNPYLTFVFALLILVLGVVSYRQLPADLLPVFETPAVQIVTFYPGMPPEVMERDIMSRLERWTGQSIGIEHQEGKAMLGVCVVKDFFRDDISFDTAMSQVTSYAMSDLYYLPPGTVPPMVMPFDPTASTPLCLVSVSSPTMSEQELYDVAYFELRNRLQSIRGVIAPAVYGGVLRRILAYVDRDRLEARDLSPMDVAERLKASAVFIPAGNAKIGLTDYQIFSDAMPRRVGHMDDTPLAMGEHGPVLLRDVGNVEDSHQIQSNIVRVNGRRQVYIPIYRQPGANSLEIVSAIRGELRSILQRLREIDPRAKDLSLDLAMDQSIPVRKSIDGLMTSAGIGALLAGLVVLVFLRSARLTIVVCLAIPLALLGAFIGLRAVGATLNAMTLGGLALAIGILVDQSIVVLENSVRHLRSGLPPIEAAIIGVREVALPVFVSTLTFIIVFYPVVYLAGMASHLFTPLALAATFAIVVSFLLSMSLIPVIVSGMKPFRTGDGAAESRPWGSVRFRSALSRVLDFRWPALGCAALLLVGASILVAEGGFELFPPVDSGQVTIQARMRTGTRIEETERIVTRMEQIIAEELGPIGGDSPSDGSSRESAVRLVISNIGVLLDWPAAYTPNTGPMDAFLLLQLESGAGKPTTFDAVRKLRTRFHSELPEVDVAFDTGGMLTSALNFGEPSPIHVQVSGGNLSTSRRIAESIVEEASRVPGAVDARIFQRLDYPVLDFKIDRIAAADLGITAEDVVENLVAVTNSTVNFEQAFWVDEANGNHYSLGVQYREEAVDSIDALLDTPISSSTGHGVVPLRKVAHVDRSSGPSVISHHNLTRVIDVYVNVQPGHDVGTVVGLLEDRLRSSQQLALVDREGPRGAYAEVTAEPYLGKGYRVELRGEVQTMRETFQQFQLGLLIAALLVYLILVAQFRSVALPLVIMGTIPLGMIGVAVVLAVTGTAFSVPAFMGVIMTVGIVVEYGILLVDFAEQRVRAGALPRDAILDATVSRLRPVVMTSLTTWIALVPMALGGPGQESNAPLARAVIGGVLAATILCLFVVPCLYVLVRRGPRRTAPTR